MSQRVIPLNGAKPLASHLVVDPASVAPGAAEQSSQDLRARGLEFLKADAFPEAIALLRHALALAPQDTRTQLNLGIALQGAKRDSEALPCFVLAQMAESHDAAPFLHAAVSLLRLGEADAAARAAGEACRRAPQSPQAHYVHGQAWLALNEPAKAERAFAAMLPLAPHSADAWVNYGIARFRQGAVEDARTAMRQALHRVPDHAAAQANLAALEATSAAAQSAEAFSEWKPADPALALGLAAEFLMQHAVFAGMNFAELVGILIGQINRGHFRLIVDERRRVQGFYGWALADQDRAEQWVSGARALSEDECRAGDCIIFNVWAAASPAARRFMVDAQRKYYADKRVMYFRKHYPDGRVRPVRLPVTRFVSSHMARAAARRNSQANTVQAP
jgi:hemolysin-activating ACP:hemolysin acyltransferase/Flp pilus assembly protein TadD